MLSSDLSKLKKIIAQSLEIEDIKINDDFNLLEAGFNSISFIKLVLSIEDLFSIEFDDDDLNIYIFPKLNDLIKYIDYKTEHYRKTECIV